MCKCNSISSSVVESAKHGSLLEVSNELDLFKFIFLLPITGFFVCNDILITLRIFSELSASQSVDSQLFPCFFWSDFRQIAFITTIIVLCCNLLQFLILNYWLINRLWINFFERTFACRGSCSIQRIGEPALEIVLTVFHFDFIDFVPCVVNHHSETSHPSSNRGLIHIKVMSQHFLRLPLAHDVSKRYFASSVGLFGVSVVDIDVHHAGLQIVRQVSVFVDITSLNGVDIDFVFQTMVKDLLDGSLVLVKVFYLSLMNQVIFCSVFDFFFTKISFFKLFWQLQIYNLGLCLRFVVELECEKQTWGQFCA